MMKRSTRVVFLILFAFTSAINWEAANTATTSFDYWTSVIPAIFFGFLTGWYLMAALEGQ